MVYKTLYEINIEDKINIDQCLHKGIYEGIGRCYDIGIFDKEHNCFYGIGFTCGIFYIETEYHYDFDPGIGTFMPIFFIDMYDGDLVDHKELKKFLDENLNRLKQRKVKVLTKKMDAPGVDFPKDSEDNKNI